MNVRPLEGPPLEALAQLSASGDVAIPETDPARLLLQIRRRNWAHAQRLSHAEIVDLDPDFDPGPEFD